MTVIKSLGLALIAVFAPIHAILGTVLALILIDATLGVMAARKRKEAITSAGLRRTLSKILIYEITIAAGFLAETYLIGGIIPLTKILATLIGLIDMKSILENADELNGEPIFKSLINKVGSANEEQQK